MELGFAWNALGADPVVSVIIMEVVKNRGREFGLTEIAAHD